MTAPEARPGGLDTNARGLLVLAVALVVGVLLLASAGRGGDDTTSKTDTGGVTTTADLGSDATTSTPSSTTAPTSDRAPSEVKVIVLNGSGQEGAAGTTSDTVGQGGYTMLKPGNAPPTEATSVFYDTDYKAEATAIALNLGKSTDAVKPLSEASLGGAELDANVVVVLGSADTPPASGSTTTTAAN